MNDSRKEIPVWTWYNGQFLFQFEEQLKRNPNKTISDFFSDFKLDQGLQDVSFYNTKNQGTVIILMFGLLVVPREIWERDSTNFQFTTRNRFTFNPPTDNNLDTLNFLRLLRNSLSHANFSIDVANAKVTFWNNYRGVKNFEVEISYGDLGVFISEVGKYYVNEVINEK